MRGRKKRIGERKLSGEPKLVDKRKLAGSSVTLLSLDSPNLENHKRNKEN